MKIVNIGSAVRLWNWRDPASVRLTITEDFNGNANITGLAFTSGGARLLVSGGTSELLDWTADTGELADLVCDVVKRDLSSQEWVDYIGPNVSYEPTCRRASGKRPLNRYGRTGADPFSVAAMMQVWNRLQLGGNMADRKHHVGFFRRSGQHKPVEGIGAHRASLQLPHSMGRSLLLRREGACHGRERRPK